MEKFLAVLKRHKAALQHLGQADAANSASGSSAPHRGSASEKSGLRSTGQRLLGAGIQKGREFLHGSLGRLRKVGGELWQRLPEKAQRGLRAAGDAIAGGLTKAAGTLTALAKTLHGIVTPPAKAATHDGPPGGLADLFSHEHLTPEQISMARELIAHQPAELQGNLFQQLQRKVPYHNQRNNQSTQNSQRIGDKMCNLTALAMALEMLGISNPAPSTYPQFEDYLESLRVKNKLPPRTDRGGWGGVAKAMGAELQILSEANTHKQQWWEAKVRPKLHAGYGIMLSITGHIVRLQEITDRGLMVDDPYGSVKLKKGTTHSWGAANKKTSASASETAGAYGEDAVWPWAEVEQHSMLWIAAIKRS